MVRAERWFNRGVRRLLLAGVVLCATVLVAPASAPAKGKPKLAGIVWFDADADGIRDRGESRARGVRVKVQRRAKKRWRRVARRRTNARGRWVVRARKHRKLRVRVKLPPAGVRISPRNRGERERRDSDVRAGKRKPGTLVVRRREGRRGFPRVDAGVVPRPVSQDPVPVPADPPPDPAPGDPPPADPPPEEPPPTEPTAGGTVWQDADGDGVRGAGEAGLAGVTVELWNAAQTTALSSTTTGANGGWASAVPQSGTDYRMRLLLPDGTIYSPPNVGGDDTVDSEVFAAGPSAGYTGLFTAGSFAVDAGIRSGPAITIGNRVWRDTNNDGLQGASPDYLNAATTVELWNDNLTQLLATTTVSGSDSYALPAIKDGTYRVRFVLPEGYVIGKQDQGTSEANDSDPVATYSNVGITPSLTFAASTVSVDAAAVALVNIGNLVWDDLNSNGIQDAGEPGYPGVTVELWLGDKSQLITSATTNASGIYKLGAPGAGDYRVRVLRPASGVFFTTKDAGSDDTKDSDINTSINNSFGMTDPFTVHSNVISMTHVDAGLLT